MSIPTGVAFARALEEAGVITDLNSITRVVIDIQPGDAARVYVERIGDNRLLGAFKGTLGMMLAENAPKGARYHVLVADELMSGDTPWASCGLTPIGREPNEPEGSPGMHWVLFEDQNAPPELEGKRVELIIRRGRQGPHDLHDSVWVGERRVIG